MVLGVSSTCQTTNMKLTRTKKLLRMLPFVNEGCRMYDYYVLGRRTKYDVAIEQAAFLQEKCRIEEPDEEIFLELIARLKENKNVERDEVDVRMSPHPYVCGHPRLFYVEVSGWSVLAFRDPVTAKLRVLTNNYKGY